jgi:N-methylhydantoinase B/oxoprolinase/acetone carboxylase alpha subunit
MRVRGTKGLPASHWVAAVLAVIVAGCGGEASADGSSSQAVEMATASDLSDAEIVVYKSPT